MNKLIELSEKTGEQLKEIAKRKGISLKAHIENVLEMEVQHYTKPRYFTREILIKNIIKSNEVLEAQLKANNDLLRGLK